MKGASIQPGGGKGGKRPTAAPSMSMSMQMQKGGKGAFGPSGGKQPRQPAAAPPQFPPQFAPQFEEFEEVAAMAEQWPQRVHPVLTPASPEMPSFMGIASRKRKWEVGAEMGLVEPLGGVVKGKGGAAGKGGKKAAFGGVAPSKGGGKAAAPPPGGKGGRQPAAPTPNPRAEAAATAAAAKDSVKWINLPAEAQFIQMGMPELGPAVFQHEAIKDLLSNSAHTLGDLGLASMDEVTMHDDPDWKEFPEVGEAIKAAGGEATSYCVAECTDRAIWAVGAAAGWKKREQCARLAMAVALAANTEDFEPLARAQPDFARFCAAVGIETGIDVNSLPPPQPVAKAPKKAAARAAAPIAEPAGPKDPPFWISVAGEEVPEVLDGMPTEALAVPNDNSRTRLHVRADDILPAILGDLAAEVTYHDDTQWTEFPTVGAQLKAQMGGEKCMTVAVCPSAGCWAVGVGMRGKNRFSAAKIALAVAIAIQNIDVGQGPEVSEFPGLQELIDEAYAARG